MADFTRIYIDSNILIASNWPKLSAAVENFLDLALVLNVKVLLPEAVEVELEEHWLRNLDKKYAGVDRSIKDFENHLGEPEPNAIKLVLPDKDKSLEGYRRRVLEVKDGWGLESIPIATRAISELLRMAARQDAPFKEEGAGFQDTVIYLSVIDDLKQKSDCVGAFISQDAMFRNKKDALITLARSSGVDLEIYHSLQEIVVPLKERLRAEMIKDWGERNSRVEQALKAKLPDVEKFVSQNLELVDGDLGLGVKVLDFKNLKVVELKNVRTPVVRKEKEPEKLSFELELELDVLVEEAFIPSIAKSRIKVGEKASPPQPFRFGDIFAGPVVEERRIPWSVEVEGVVQADDADYKNIQFSSVLSKGTSLMGLSLSNILRTLSTSIEG
jgi:hypothetical protein